MPNRFASPVRIGALRHFRQGEHWPPSER